MIRNILLFVFLAPIALSLGVIIVIAIVCICVGILSYLTPTVEDKANDIFNNPFFRNWKK